MVQQNKGTVNIFIFLVLFYFLTEMEVKGKYQGQGIFAILLVRKVQFIQFMTYLSEIEVKWSEKKHQIIDKI